MNYIGRAVPLELYLSIIQISVSYSQEQVRIAWKQFPTNPSFAPLRVNPNIRLSEYYLTVTRDTFTPILINSELNIRFRVFSFIDFVCFD